MTKATLTLRGHVIKLYTMTFPTCFWTKLLSIFSSRGKKQKQKTLKDFEFIPRLSSETSGRKE